LSIRITPSIINLTLLRIWGDSGEEEEEEEEDEEV